MLEGITDFIIEHGEGLYNEEKYVKLYDAIARHVEYKTIIVIKDDIGIKAVCRFNFLTPSMVYVIDLVCRNDCRGYGLVKEVIKQGKKDNPAIKYFSFERGKKYPNKLRKVYKVSDILKRRN